MAPVKPPFPKYSESPTYGPSSGDLSKMRTCVEFPKLVYMSGIHCHVPASFVSDCDFVHFTVQYCIAYSSTASLFQAQDVQKERLWY